MFLKDGWLTKLRAGVRGPLRDIGKGWFNLEETNWEVYRMSKISKLMESVRFMMQVNSVLDCSFVCLRISIRIVIW